jgi:hypothetical protein
MGILRDWPNINILVTLQEKPVFLFRGPGFTVADDHLHLVPTSGFILEKLRFTPSLVHFFAIFFDTKLIKKSREWTNCMEKTQWHMLLFIVIFSSSNYWYSILCGNFRRNKKQEQFLKGQSSEILIPFFA